QAVAFDAYGTLIDFNEGDFIATMGQICEQQGLVADASDIWQRFLRSAINFHRRNHAGSPAHWRYSDAWPLHFADVFRSLRLDGDPMAASSYLREVLAEAPAYPEAYQVIDSLSQSHRIALLSNADDDFLFPCLERNRLRFETIVTSEQARALKPNPAIFHRLAAELDLRPSSILYVGDSPVPDVLGGCQAGFKVAWVNRSGLRRPRNVPEPHLRLGSLTELVSLLHG
ncbi:MAG TPA: HAD family hydrolase, partial [Dehalococcoidia bacterium]|nr:HAD family hydrolase [Dehalococcoidia bacterium]